MTPLEALALELLSIPSVTGAEAALADHLERRARAAGFARVARAGDSLALWPHPPRAGHPRLLLLGHLDTVPPAGANPPRLEAGRLFGLGASDMKCADALLLTVLEAARARPAAADLVGVLYAREEGPFDASGLPEVAAAAPEAFAGVDLALALEPTDNHLELGCLGTLHAWVRFQGQAAHSARPWQGRNAIHAAAPLLGRLAALAPRDVVQEGLTFREVCSATLVRCEGARNVVPREFAVNLNLRFAPDRSLPEAEAHLEAFVREAVGEAAWARGEVRVEVTDRCPAGAVVGRNALLEGLLAAGAGRVKRRAKQAWTDVGRLSAWGIPAANFGPGAPAQAHQAGEWCSRAALADADALFRAWLWGR